MLLTLNEILNDDKKIKYFIYNKIWLERYI